MTEVDAGLVIDAGLPVFDAGPLDAGSELLADAGLEAGPPPPILTTRLWKTELPAVGTSSPRLTELTGDGVLDVVLAGGREGMFGNVYAVDGKTGKQLWRRAFSNDLYATPALADVTGDGVADVVIGGRDYDGTALDGKTGKPLWRLRKKNPKVRIPDRNFNGAEVLPDQDGDGVTDFVFTQGGMDLDRHRVPGLLLIVSGATGLVLHRLEMPDKRETYSLPAVVEGRQPLELVFGSGGENLPGSLFRFGFGCVVDGGAPCAEQWRLPSEKKGFIASPAVVDLDGSGTLDVIETSFEGTVMRVDGTTGQLKWASPHKEWEGYASPGFGRFDGDETLDVVASFMRGTFPNYQLENAVVWFDGKTGRTLDERKQGVFSSASPLTADLDGDGFDETITMAMNSFEVMFEDVRSTLVVYDGRPGREVRLKLEVKGAGSATPVLADLEQDGTLDLVFAYFGSLERHRVEVPGGKPWKLRWPQFRGPHENGFSPK